jgi:hypothetical protein
VQLESLVLLEHDPGLQALVATWPACGHAEGDWKRSIDAWSRASGIAPWLIRLAAPRLFLNGICAEDGTAASEALAFLRSRIKKSL